MNSFKFKKLQFLFLALTLVFLFSSCEKEESIPDYVGTWIAIESIEGFGVYTKYKDVLTITESEFSDLGQMFNSSTNEWIDYRLVKASIVVTDDLVNSSILELGITSFDSSNFPTGVLTYYTESSEQFDQLVELMGFSKTWVSEFHVSEGELILNVDNNGDGDYLDSRETMIFTKK